MKAHTIYNEMARLTGESILELIKSPADGLAATVFVWLANALGQSVTSLPPNWNQAGPNYYRFTVDQSSAAESHDRPKGKDLENVELVAAKMGVQDLVFNARVGSQTASCTLAVPTYMNSSFFTRQDSEDIHEMYVSEDSTDKLLETVSKHLGSLIQGNESGGVGENSSKSKNHINNTNDNMEKETAQQEEQFASRLQETSSSRGSFQPSYESASQDPSRRSSPDPPGPVFSIKDRGTPARRETPPGFEDEYEMLGRPSSTSGPVAPPIIGDRDLYPDGIGPYPRLEPVIGVHDRGLGGIGGPDSGGGMYMGRDHPFFRNRGPGANNGYPDDLTRPQGARWDPPGPGSGFGFGSGGGGSNGFGF